MITQVIWTDVNNRELDNIYARSGDEEIREIQFIICRNDPPEKVEIPAGVSGQFRMIKSSGNFVVRDMKKTVHEDGTVIFTVAVSDQMVNVQGTGYYDIRLSGGGYLYTASGRFIVDTPVISSSVLEDVSEVNGVVFPDDFYTKDDQVAVIDDNTISNVSTWSSEKINNQIGVIIDDNTISNGRTWSSEKTHDEIENNRGKHDYSTTEQVIGKWIDGNTIYEKTIYSHDLIGVNDWAEFDASVSYYILLSVNGLRFYNNQRFSFTNSLESTQRFQIKNNGKLYYFTPSTISGDIYITVRYTKEGD